MWAIEYKGFDHVWKYTGPWLYYLIAFYLSLPVLAYIVLPTLMPARRRRTNSDHRSITLFVLGDIGHSPRMCYHARSLAKLNYQVTICGYLETSPPEDILEDENISIQSIKPIKRSGLPFILFAIKKLVLQSFQILQLLFEECSSNNACEYIMIQNPPSIPILVLAIVFAKIQQVFLGGHKINIVVDWHNLNYSILNLKYNNESHPFVQILKLYEHYLGKYGCDYHITVTHKMKEFLIEKFHIEDSKILVVHDRPAEGFEPLDNLGITQTEVLRNIELFDDVENVETYKVLVSATSFTADEDFNVLLDALKKYDMGKTSQQPPLLLIVTGKGPLKQQFLDRVAFLKFSKNVIIKTAWLSFEDYPVVLASADLAVSLHTSSSGIDLPMKIVDFFGCGVPVITLNFPAIDELVKDGVNGLITKNKSDSLVKESDELYRLITLAFTDADLLQTIKAGAMNESNLRWDENWDKNLGKKLFN